jgi:hypothetical protein
MTASKQSVSATKQAQELTTTSRWVMASSAPCTLLSKEDLKILTPTRLTIESRLISFLHNHQLTLFDLVKIWNSIRFKRYWQLKLSQKLKQIKDLKSMNNKNSPLWSKDTRLWTSTLRIRKCTWSKRTPRMNLTISKSLNFKSQRSQRSTLCKMTRCTENSKSRIQPISHLRNNMRQT